MPAASSAGMASVLPQELAARSPSADLGKEDVLKQDQAAWQEDGPLPSRQAMLQELDAETCARFGRHAFKDHRWDNTLEFVRGLPDYGPERVRDVLCQGAKAFGIWRLPEACLQGLIDQVMVGEGEASPAMKHMLMRSKSDADLCQASASHELQKRCMRAEPTVSAEEVQKYKEGKSVKWLTWIFEASSVQWTWRSILAIVFVVSNLYAVKVCWSMYPDAIKILRWPIYFARMGGMAAALWTSVMYWTMARGFLSKMYICMGGKRRLFVAPLDAHKDIHILSGCALFACGVVHILAHLLGTVPGILTHTAEEINILLGCANKDTNEQLITWVDFSAVQWPKCPLETVPRSVEEILFATLPGLTGVLLTLLLALMTYTGRVQGRKNNFDVFYYVHNVGLVLWPVLLFFHGSNAWVGVGFPLVVFTAGLPAAFYLLDRVHRALRYYLFAGSKIFIKAATVRPGKGKDPADGALTYLEIAPPPFLWHFRPGMYGFLCMPEYAPLQWHPFTICSGEHDETVDFLISGVGDWTRELARRVMESQVSDTPMPKVALDGPFMAPTQSALAKEVLVVVGAGVGITPFLSLMSTIITSLDGCENTARMKYACLKEIHFYWMTRSADEFLFGRKHFSRILRSRNLLSKVFLHLHLTGQPPARDPAAFLFREALKRQSKIDLKTFSAIAAEERLHVIAGPQLPWCWANGASEDILWVSDLAEQKDMVSTEVSEMPRGYSNRRVTVARSFVGTPPSESVRRSRRATEKQDAADIGLLVPIVFGRPDFAHEIRSIGKARPGKDVCIYVCGNDAVVSNLFDVAGACNEHATEQARTGEAPRQTYRVYFERFG